MSYRTVDPAGAKELLGSGEGWTYLDVRTVEEFEAGHAEGAWNVPFAVLDPAAGGLVPNPDFVDVVARHFDRGAKLVVACAAGGRSMQACEMLAAAGFSELANMHGGFGGTQDMSGAYLPGWQALGYPTETAAPAERRYDSLRAARG